MVPGLKRNSALMIVLASTYYEELSLGGRTGSSLKLRNYCPRLLIVLLGS